jgi:hypothetical protein
MLKNKLLLFGAFSALFSTSIVAVETEKCVGGACFVKLDKKEPSKKVESDEPLKVAPVTQLLENEVDKSATIILDGEMITVFPKSSYLTTEAQQDNYMIYEEALPIVEDKIEDVILDRVIKLPNSEYFCEKDSMPVVHKESGFYECV